MKPVFFVSTLVLIGLAACTPVRSTATPRGPYPLATPVSDSPAAGICGGAEGKVVTITIYPDIPDPRCAIVRPDQVLEVVNSTQGQLQIHIGPFDASLEPGARTTVDVPFGEYLAPGVHRVQVLPCCGPELVLETGSK